MALYEYKCSNEHCQTVVENSFSINDTNLVIGCFFCGQPSYRIISRSNFHLLGGNWAKDLYNGKGKKP